MTTLDDAAAIHILQTIAQARLQSAASPPTADLRATLAAVFPDAPPTPASEGDLAAPRSPCSPKTPPTPSLSRSWPANPPPARTDTSIPEPSP